MAKKIKGLTVEVNGDISGFSNELRKIEAETKKTKKSLRNLNSALKLDPTNTDLLKQKQELLTQAVKDTEKELKDLLATQEMLDSKGANKLHGDYTKLQLEIEKAKKSLKELNAEKVLLSQTKIDINGLDALNTSLNKTAESAKKLSDATKNISLASALGLAGGAFSAAQYERDIANIKKIYKDLSDSTVENLKQISIATGSTFSAISEYATIGAALGVAEKDLSIFTQTMKELETVTGGNIIGEEGAAMVARFLNVMNIGTDQAHNFASALTIVEDSLAVTAGEVLEVSSRLAGLSSIGNITQHDIIGISAVMKNLGLRTESSATAINKLFLEINNDVLTSSDRLQTLAKVAGKSADEFASAWRNKPMDAFLELVDGLKGQVFNEISSLVKSGSSDIEQYASALHLTSDAFKELWNENPKKMFDEFVSSMENMGDETSMASKLLTDLDISSVRVAETMLKLAGNGNTVKKMIDESTKAWDENTALTDKAGTIYETTTEQIKGAWEAIKQAAATIGVEFLPAIKDGAEEIKEFSEWFKNLNPAVKKTIAYSLTLATVTSPLFKVYEKASSGLAKFVKAQKDLVISGGKVSPLFKLLSAGINKLGVSAGTVGAVGFTALAAAMGVSYLATNRHKSAIEETQDSLKNYDNTLKSINESSQVNFVNSTIELEMNKKKTQQIDELVGTLQSLDGETKDYTDTENQLLSLLGDVNAELGNGYSWDAQNKQIINTKGEVVKLKDEYLNLMASMKQQAWLEAYRAEYLESVQQQKELTKKRGELLTDITTFITDAEKTSGTLLQEALIHYQKGNDMNQYIREHTKNLSAQESAILQGQGAELRLLYDSYVLVGSEVDNLSQSIQNYDAIAGASAEDAQYLIHLNDLGVGFAKTAENAQLLIDKRNKIQEQISALDSLKSAFTPEDYAVEKQRLEADLEAIEQQISGIEQGYIASGTTLEAEMAKNNQQLVANTETQATNSTQHVKDTYKQGAEEIATNIQTTTDELAKNTENAMVQSFENGKIKIEEKGAQMSENISTYISNPQNLWDNWSPAPKMATFTVKTVYEGGAPSDYGYSQSQSSYRSIQPQDYRMLAYPQTLNADKVYNDLNTLNLNDFATQTVVQKNLLNEFNRSIESIGQSLNQSKEINLDKALEKAFKNVKIEVIVNNDLDGRELSSRISKIQGLNFKKSNAR